MLSLLGIYNLVPIRLRFIVRWIAMALFILVVIGVLIIFYRVYQAAERNHGHFSLHPHSHQPPSPDSIAFRLDSIKLRKEGL